MKEIKKYLNKDKIIAVIGLGYVGLPLALLLANKFRVIGYDTKQSKIRKLLNQEDPSNELGKSDFEETDILFTSDEEKLSLASFYIIAVPTPIDNRTIPDLSPLISATSAVSKHLKSGDYFVVESTVYPGCTEEVCVPILEDGSNLKVGRDFKVGYSPERINPGDKKNKIDNINKVVSGIDAEALDLITELYGAVLKGEIFKASSIKVAEAVKVMENTQRDLNISFMNEMAIIFDRLGIDTKEVLQAAATKWNALNFYPGLVGGHCIGVDPYYLLYKSKQSGYDPEVILSGRRVNDQMHLFIAKKLIKALLNLGKDLKSCRVLVMGITFKENVTDIRNSRIIEMAKELMQFALEVDIIDPGADPDEVMDYYDLELKPNPTGKYDAVIVAVNHKEYMNLDKNFFLSIMKKDPILFDLKRMYNFSSKNLIYWGL